MRFNGATSPRPSKLPFGPMFRARDGNTRGVGSIPMKLHSTYRVRRHSTGETGLVAEATAAAETLGDKNQQVGVVNVRRTTTTSHHHHHHHLAESGAGTKTVVTETRPASSSKQSKMSSSVLKRSQIYAAFLSDGDPEILASPLQTMWWKYWLSPEARSHWTERSWTRRDIKRVIVHIHPDKRESNRSEGMHDEEHAWMDALCKELLLQNGADCPKLPGMVQTVMASL
eukprot:gene10941-17055_t